MYTEIEKKKYESALRIAKEYINAIDEEDGGYSTIEQQYIELREVLRQFIPEYFFKKLMKKHNTDRPYSL